MVVNIYALFQRFCTKYTVGFGSLYMWTLVDTLLLTAYDKFFTNCAETHNSKHTVMQTTTTIQPTICVLVWLDWLVCFLTWISIECIFSQTQQLILLGSTWSSSWFSWMASPFMFLPQLTQDLYCMRLWTFLTCFLELNEAGVHCSFLIIPIISF